MAIPIEEIVGEENLAPEARAQVIELLRQVTVLPVGRRVAYARWARAVGIDVLSEDLDLVATSGNRLTSGGVEP